jgi:preprotein translocase subunit SecG
MNCKRIKFYWIFILLFFFSSCCVAQTNNKSVTDASDTAAALDSTGNDSENIGDTVVTKTVFDNSNDSTLKWKRSPEFGYMAYLDSLLKKKKNNLRIDTISIGKNTGSSRGKAISTVSSASNGFLNSFPVKIFFWLIAIFFIVIILYKLFFKGGLFTRENIKHDKEPALEEPEKLNEYSAYNELVHEAELRNDFNLAIRYLYLQSLRRLSDSELIFFSPDKTNKIYVKELNGHACQFEFASLTLNYEYVWYGKFAINLDRYQRIKSEFILFNKKI